MTIETGTGTPYVPIDCDQHSVLELLAMRRMSVTLWATGDDGNEIRLHGTVCDVRTRAGAEYLVLREPPGTEHAIRLDRLRVLHDEAGSPVWRQESANATGD